MKVILEKSKSLLLLFREVRTREYIYFSYLIKEISCFYSQLYERVEIKNKKSWISKSTIFLFCLILSYSETLNNLLFSGSGANYIWEAHSIFLELGFEYGI